MKPKLLGSSILTLCLYSLPLPAAQDPPDEHPAGRPQAAGPVAPTLTLPAGTMITVRVTDLLSSDRNKAGDTVTTVLEQPLVSQGWVVSRRGQTVAGRVEGAQSAGRVRGVSQLAVDLTELSLVDGQQLPIRTRLVRGSAGTSQARDAGGIAATTGIGAAIGGAAGGGTGAAIGAAAGAVAGIAGVLTTRGRPTEILPETVLTFRLEEPLSISTVQSQQAFRAVTPGDYESGPRRYVPRAYQDRYRAARVYAPLPPYYPYYAPYPPPPYVGYYGFYGFGPGFYVVPAPRAYVLRGYRRYHY